MFKQFVENRIRKHGKGYYCKLCENYLNTKEDALAHIDPSNVFHNTLQRANFNVLAHLRNTKNVAKIKNQLNEAFGGQNDGKNSMLKKAVNVSTEGESNNEKQYLRSPLKPLECKLCKVHVKSEKCLMHHQQGKMHKINAKKREISQENVPNVSNSNTNTKVDTVIVCSPKTQHAKHEAVTVYSPKAQNTKLDAVTVDSPKKPESPENISNFPLYTCFMCDVTFPDSNTIIQHFKAPENGCSIASLFRPNELDGGVFSCGLCLNNIPNDAVCLIQHTQGTKHRNNAQKERKKSQQNVLENDPMTPCNSISECSSDTKRDEITVCKPKAPEPAKNIFDLPVYNCFLCDRTFSYYGTAVQHFTERDNGCSISSLLKPDKFDTKILRCGLCLMNVSNATACLLEHSQGKNHKIHAEKEKEKLQRNLSEYNQKAKCNPIPKCDPNKKPGAVTVCDSKVQEPVKSIFNLPVYNCFMCDSTFSDYGTAILHFTRPHNGCSIASKLKPKINILSCGICLMNVPNSEACLLEHTQGKNHKYNVEMEREKSKQVRAKVNQSKKRGVAPICTALEPPYTCFTCNGIFSDKDAIARHFFESKLPCSAPSFIKKFPNVDNKVLFSCKLCCATSFKSFDELLIHTQGKRHKNKTQRGSLKHHLNYSSYNSVAKGTPDCKPNEECYENGRKRVPEVSISSTLVCAFCKNSFSGKDIEQHSFQPDNDCRAFSFLRRSFVNEKTFYSCLLCHVCVVEQLDFILHTQGKEHRKNCELQRKLLGFGVSTEKAESKQDMKKNIVHKKDISTILMNISNIDVSYYCNVCNITAGSDLKLFKHLNELQHIDRSTKFPKNSQPPIYCPACKFQISEDEAIKNHLDSSEHKRKLFIFFANADESKYNEICVKPGSEPIAKENNENSVIQNKPSGKSRKPKIEGHHQSAQPAQDQEISKSQSLIDITNINIVYKCYVCNTAVNSDLQLIDHLEDLKHKNSLSTLPRDFVPYIYCPLCKSDIFEDEEMISHLKSDEHKESLSDLSAKFGSKGGNVNPNQVDLQIDLLSGSKTILDELCSEMIRKPRRPKAELKIKNKFIPHFSEKYSRMFLEIGPSNIFNVDQRKMEILNSGIALSFLVDDERLCLVCNQRIPNSLQILYEHLLNVDHLRKLDQLVLNDLEFEHFRDQFSDLALAKEFMIEVNDDVTFCFPCKAEIKNDDSVIKKHVESDENHRVKSQEQKELSQAIFKELTEQLNNVWYIVQRFWCQVCNAKFEFDIDFAEHIEGKKHVREVKKLLSNKINLCCDVCIPCASMSLGLSDTYTKHCLDNMHKYLVKSKDYAVPEMIKPALNLLNNVEETAESLVLESNAAQFVEKKIDLVLKRLEEIVKSHYPEAKAYVFGSRGSYLAFRDSDVDIFLDCGNAYNGTQLLSKTREYLLNSQICFESQPDEWELKEVLLKVRAPIIRVCHRELGLNCDVSFTSGLTVEKTKVVRLFMISYPPCRKMVLFLKKWLNTCSLTDSQGLTTFGITWLVIFYLQQIKVLPSIAELIKNKSKSQIVAGWETGIGEKIRIKDCSLKFRELLRGFFEFYGTYDYRSYVICPLMGESLRKQDFTDNRIDDLPSEMESYSCCIQSTSKPEIFRIDSPLCLQDPIDLMQNITRSVSKLILRCFIQYCRTSAEKLSNLGQTSE